MTISSDFDPNAIIRTASRLPERPKLSSAEIKRRAETYLIAPPSAELLRAYRLTLTGGVIGMKHYRKFLKVAPRTIRKYTELGVLERLPDRTPKLRQLGFTEPAEDLRLYSLGPVGYAMAEMENIPAPAGYHAMVDRVTHDFLASQVIVHLLHYAEYKGIPWQWRNRYQATVKFNFGGGIEPDAAVLLEYPPHRVKVYLLELHNEDHQKRVPDKLYRYWRSGLDTIADRSPWWGATQPTLLIAAPTLTPLSGYTAAFRDPNPYIESLRLDRINGRDYLPSNPTYGITLPQLAKQQIPDVWMDLRSGQCTNILTDSPVKCPPRVQ